MKRRLADDSGVALVFALFAVLILTGLATLLVSDSFSQQQAARDEVDYEGGLHVAEAGAESTIARLEATPEFNTGETWDGVTDERDWAVAQALAAPTGRLVGTADGESVAIRSTGSANANFVYGVGFVPSRAAYVANTKGSTVRVVRMKLAFEPIIYGGDNAILTESNLKMSGSPAKWELVGSHARVHTNGFADVQGRVVEKGISAVEAGPNGCTYKTSPLAVGTTPCTIAPSPVSVPKVSALALYNTPDAVALRQSTDEWFDLCPSGVKTGKDASGDPTTEPCTGQPAAGTFAFSGGATGACGGTWTPTANNRPAVYYARCGHFSSSGGGSRTASIIASAVNGVGGTVDLGGSFQLNGYTSPNSLPWKILVLADGDIKFHGNPFGAQPFDNPMLVATAGLMDWKGSPTTKNIGFLSSKAKISGGAGYDVSGGGSGSMEYNGGLNVALGGVANPSIIDWEEL